MTLRLILRNCRCWNQEDNARQSLLLAGQHNFLGLWLDSRSPMRKERALMPLHGLSIQLGLNGPHGCLV